MNGHNKKFLLLLGTGVFLAVVLFAVQIRKNFSFTTKPADEPLVSTESYEIPLGDTESLLGNPGAEVTLVAYIDFGSYNSRLLYQQLVATVRAHPKNLRLFLKHAPYSSFFFASTHEKIHEAILCADNQKKQWAYADALANISTLWRLGQLTEAATSAKLDITTFNNCLSSQITTSELQAISEASRPLAPAVPALYANNRRITLSKDLDITKLLESFIAP